MAVNITVDGAVVVIEIDRPEKRNAVDGETARLIYDAFKAFDANDDLSVAILTGSDGHFCAGADLKAVAKGNGNPVLEEGDMAPMGPGRLRLSKPVIAAVEGYAVAGGFELAIWCDLRVVSTSAVFGVFCRRWGVPLIDLGTINLPRLIGQSRAADLILTGREVNAEEAQEIGLANRVVPIGEALNAAKQLAQSLAEFPQNCLRSDRRSMYEQWSLDQAEAIKNETQLGLTTIRSGESEQGAAVFAGGQGRHGSFAKK